MPPIFGRGWPLCHRLQFGPDGQSRWSGSAAVAWLRCARVRRLPACKRLQTLGLLCTPARCFFQSLRPLLPPPLCGLPEGLAGLSLCVVSWVSPPLFGDFCGFLALMATSETCFIKTQFSDSPGEKVIDIKIGFPVFGRKMLVNHGEISIRGNGQIRISSILFADVWHILDNSRNLACSNRRMRMTGVLFVP